MACYKVHRCLSHIHSNVIMIKMLHFKRENSFKCKTRTEQRHFHLMTAKPLYYRLHNAKNNNKIL